MRSVRANHRRLPQTQFAIEQWAIRFRADLGISDYEELPLDVAARAIPGCVITGLRHLPGVTLEQVVYARDRGYCTFFAMAKLIDDRIHIVFNDAHYPLDIRVNVMEEICHVLLGHRPDIVTNVPRDGRYRTHDSLKEAEAQGAAKAALVPYSALYEMLIRQKHIAWIAEHFGVSIDVVQDRIAATQLGDLMNAQFLQYSLNAEYSPVP